MRSLMGHIFLHIACKILYILYADTNWRMCRIINMKKCDIR